MSADAIDIRLRTTSPDLLALPWLDPLAEWDATVVPFRDVPVGPSRHLVRFVDTSEGLLAIKEEPDRVVQREYGVLRELEARRLPAVRAAGMVLRGNERDGLLVTRFLERSWQFRRLFMRLPEDSSKQRARLLAAMANLLVELHRAGVFWGDCSLANTLFMRDGQILQAHLVDAETSEIHARLSDGQREYDLAIMVENVLGGLLDIASRRGQADDIDSYIEAAESVAATYRDLWAEVHRDLDVEVGERWRVASHLQRLTELGYTVDEVKLGRGSDGQDEKLHVTVAVAGRDRHAEELRAMTGLSVGQGQAIILLADARAYASRLGPDVDPRAAGWEWRREVFAPGLDLVRSAGIAGSDPVQALCDLFEVRWLLSEKAGRDVGAQAALAALKSASVPSGAAASMAVLEAPTGEYPTEE